MSGSKFQRYVYEAFVCFFRAPTCFVCLKTLYKGPGQVSKVVYTGNLERTVRIVRPIGVFRTVLT